MKSAQSTTVESTYQKKTQIEHVLIRPDTYIGSIDLHEEKMWVLDSKFEKIISKKISYVPGLYKIFDEIIVNAADNFHRDKSMTMIKVTIDKDKGTIAVWNNGKGLPIQMHQKEKVYVPELVFGHMLTSSNYDDSIKKVTGGRNGFGAKLTNIFSKEFKITTGDTKEKKLYSQVFKNNLSQICEPKISAYSSDQYDFTEVCFQPDFKRFKMSGFDDDTISLLSKRVYDLAGVTSASVKVYLNNKKININNFQSYCDLYLDQDAFKAFDTQDRWQICISEARSQQFEQVSFVNSICTLKGGTHVDKIANQISDKIIAEIKKQHKKLEFNKKIVKQSLWVFLNAQIENPAFSSQTKETLTSLPQSFGSNFQLSDALVKKILASPIVKSVVQNVLDSENRKAIKELGTSGKKKQKLYDVPKLDDANWAGTERSQQCTLILTEGDSAKALAVAGLQVVGRDQYGVFPLKGKLLNVRDAPEHQILKNEEIQSLIKIIGLNPKETYSNPASLKLLRYGCVMLMTDQDHDGSHIKGLLINFLHFMWPNLLKYNFLKEFVTPIIKVTKGDNMKSFFTIADYERWEQENSKKGFSIKYYKGLGTSTAKEAKDYFSDLLKHVITFKHSGNEKEVEDAITLAFQKSQAENRKEWLKGYDPTVCIDHNKKTIGYREFIDKELIHFSVADNQRSIPNLVDGLKPSQRKIIFSLFKRLPAGQKVLRPEIKVAQLSGYVAEHSAYHHGEVSLSGTIVNMAQDFVGSNNINLLQPIGQFGTRHAGGKDFASSRYIFTNLSPLTRLIFPEEDSELFKYQQEEGLSIEPNFYIPILPMILVNGAEGIGTGWSSSVPQFNPLDIINQLKRKINGEGLHNMVPWYRGYTGSIAATDQNSFITTGRFKVSQNDVLEIFELPIHRWIFEYKQFLEQMAQNNEIESIKEYHKDHQVHFKLKVPGIGKESDEQIIKRFKLQSNISLGNMVMFSDCQLKRYSSPNEIISEFYPIRLGLYIERRKHLLKQLRDELKILEQKHRFVQGIISREIQFNNMNKQQLVSYLIAKGFTPSEDGDFDFLLQMPIWSLCQDRLEELQNKIEQRKKSILKLESTTVEQMWREELDKLAEAYIQDLNANYSHQDIQKQTPSQTPTFAPVKIDTMVKKPKVAPVQQKLNLSQNASVKQAVDKKDNVQSSPGKQQSILQKRTVSQAQSDSKPKKSQQANKIDKKGKSDSSESLWSDSSSEQEVIRRHQTSTRFKLDESNESKPTPSKKRDLKMSEKQPPPKETSSSRTVIDITKSSQKQEEKLQQIDLKPKVDNQQLIGKTQEQVSAEPLSLRERLLLKDKGLSQVVQSVFSQREPSPIQIEKPSVAVDIIIQGTIAKPQEILSENQDIEMQHRHRRRQIDESD